MPTRRSNGVYYIQRKVPGFGNLYLSLGTKRKGLADLYETMILDLARQGLGDLVRAWQEDEVSLARIREARDTGRLHELVAGLRVKDRSVTAATKAALQAKSADVADSTLERYTTGLRHFEDFVGGGSTVREVLTDDTLSAFKAHRREAVTRSTVNKDLIAVSVLASYSLAQGWIDEKPRIRQFDVAPRMRWLEPTEIHAYLEALRPDFVVQMEVLFGAGLRLIESEHLRVLDLYLDDARAVIGVTRSKTSAGSRRVPIPGWLAEELRSHVAQHRLRGADRLFQAHRRVVQREHGRACEAAGIVDYRLHDHRHTYGVHNSKAGVPLPVLRRWMGHENIDTTMVYADFAPSQREASALVHDVAERMGLASPHNKTDNIMTRAPRPEHSGVVEGSEVGPHGIEP